MKLNEWLKKEGKTQRWLSAQLGGTEALVSNMFNRKKHRGTPLPYTWIPAVLRITNGEVSIEDEWPEKRQKTEEHAGNRRKKAQSVQRRERHASVDKKKVRRDPDSRISKRGDTGMGNPGITQKMDGL